MTINPNLKTDDVECGDTCPDGKTHKPLLIETTEAGALNLAALLEAKALLSAAKDFRQFQIVTHKCAANAVASSPKFLVKFEVRLRCEMWVEAETEGDAIELLETLTPLEIASSAVSEPLIDDTWVVGKLNPFVRK